MTSTSVPGFITKKDAAEHYQRSHRQITRDLADAMKVQDPKVLDHCRLRTEDGQLQEGMGITPELIDRLRLDGKNPVWYLRTSWLENNYGRRGRVPRRDHRTLDTDGTGAEEGSDSSTRPELVHVLRERIKSLEQDKQDLREEMKIKNQQISERVEREKETNALIRDLHTLMADLQRRLLPPPTHDMRQTPSGYIDSQAESPPATPRANEPPTTKEKTPVASKTVRKEPRRSAKSRPPKRKRAVKKKRADVKKVSARKDSPTTAASASTKSRGLWSRLFTK